jgi:hypothetical protein
VKMGLGRFPFQAEALNWGAITYLVGIVPGNKAEQVVAGYVRICERTF